MSNQPFLRLTKALPGFLNEGFPFQMNHGKEKRDPQGIAQNPHQRRRVEETNLERCITSNVHFGYSITNNFVQRKRYFIESQCICLSLHYFSSLR